MEGTLLHVSRFNHSKHLLATKDADSSTNCSESINRTLNEGCPPLRKKEKIYDWVHKHKFNNVGKYFQYVNQNHQIPQRREETTLRFEKYYDLCFSFSELSNSQNIQKLFSYIRSFAEIDKYEITVDSEESEEYE